MNVISVWSKLMLPLENLLATIAGVVGALGGLGAIAAGVAKLVSDHTSQKWLQKNKAQLDKDLEKHRNTLLKEVEHYRLSLKRQELIYHRELEAGEAFTKLWGAVYPKNNAPDMDWHDACSNTARRLGQIENALELYLQIHSVAISDEARILVEGAQARAASEKFSVDDDHTTSPPQSAIDAAGEALDHLRKARDRILADLRR